jgi:GT2 family glycosyltransferase/glycosyltransferase involved in cell wall biosynthesis
MLDLPKVSIVIINLNARQRLPKCFKSLLSLNYPKDKLEIIVVDNASTDGSVDLIKNRFKSVKLLANESDIGPARSYNDGVRAATGEFVAFLYNDARVDKNWLAELVNSLNSSSAQCAGSVITDRSGKWVDFAGGSIDVYGEEFYAPLTELGSGLSEDRQILYPRSGAMIINRQIFLDVGGFDEDYFACLEDVDLGWRLNLLGHKVVLSVKSRVYRAEDAAAYVYEKDKLDFLKERNRLYTIYKNYGEELFPKVFLSSVLLDIKKAWILGGINSNDYAAETWAVSAGADVRVNGSAAVKLAAMNDFIGHIAETQGKRANIQGKRKAADNEITGYFTEPFHQFENNHSEYQSTQYDMVKLFGIDSAFGADLKRKILIISNEIIGRKMAGPGIRYWEMSKCLADTDKFEVVLACPGGCEISYDGVRTISYTLSDYDVLLQTAAQVNVVMVQGYVLNTIKALRDIVKSKYVIVDIYDPYLIENFETFKNKTRSFKDNSHRETLACLEYQLKLGDFFICANDKQSDYWMGMLSAYNRVNPGLYDIDDSAKKLIDTVPFGISDASPVHGRNVLKGVWPGIEKDDKVLIWGGGVWNWFDPLTLIKAVKLVSEKRRDVKLFFMGVRHPNPDVPEMQMLNNAVGLAKELGLYNKFVFFNFGWVDYNDRQNYLLEADIGVSCHFDTLETRFSFRTRMLDYLWAGLPIVCTKGDNFSNLVESETLGLTADYEDSQQLAAAVIRLLDDKSFYDACKQNVAKVAGDYKWSRVTKPVVEFCNHPLHLGLRDFEDESSADKGNSGPMRQNEKPTAGRGHIDDRLNRIEKQQNFIQQQLQKSLRRSEKIEKIVTELQSWSYMFNERFNKLKKYANPVALIKRLFRRR